MQNIISDNQETKVQEYLEAICNKNSGFVILNASDRFEKGEKQYFIENFNERFLHMTGLCGESCIGETIEMLRDAFLEHDYNEMVNKVLTPKKCNQIIEIFCKNTNRKVKILISEVQDNRISLILFEINKKNTFEISYYQNEIVEIVYALETMLKKRDLYTYRHQIVVALLATTIAEKMGLSKEQKKGIYICGLLHDIGKIAIPMELLTKPDILAEAEYEILKSHVNHSYEILKNIDFPWPVADIVLQHHERMDGSGYPKGLVQHEILLEAQILSVADVLEAMVADRPYRSSMGLGYSLSELQKNAGKKFSIPVVHACVELLKDKDWSMISAKAKYLHHELLMEPS